MAGDDDAIERRIDALDREYALMRARERVKAAQADMRSAEGSDHLARHIATMELALANEALAEMEHEK